MGKKLVDYVAGKYEGLTTDTLKMIRYNVDHAEDKAVYAKTITDPELVKLAKSYDKEAGPAAAERIVGSVIDLANRDPKILKKFGKLMNSKEAMQVMNAYGYTNDTTRITNHLAYLAEKESPEDFKQACKEILEGKKQREEEARRPRSGLDLSLDMIIPLIGLIIGMIFFSSGINGNVIGNLSQNNTSMIGVVVFIMSILVGLCCSRRK